MSRLRLVCSILWMSSVVSTAVAIAPVRYALAATPPPCTVTIPDRGTPSDAALPGDFGTADLRTIIPFDGIVPIPSHWMLPDGSLSMKFPWWWDPGLGEALVIAGRRTDASAPPLRTEPLTRPDTSTALPETRGGTWTFQAVIIIFPTEGCWEVTGRVGRATLTYMALVRPADARSTNSA